MLGAPRRKAARLARLSSLSWRSIVGCVGKHEGSTAGNRKADRDDLHDHLGCVDLCALSWALPNCPMRFLDWITSLEHVAHVILICILLAYAVLGMFMDAIGMLLLTLPVVYPAVMALNGGRMLLCRRQCLWDVRDDVRDLVWHSGGQNGRVLS